MTEMKRLYRSRSDRMLAGVCGGLAEFLEVDPTIVRLAFVVGIFLSVSIIFWVYVVMAVVVPLEPEGITAPPAPVAPAEPVDPASVEVIPPTE